MAEIAGPFDDSRVTLELVCPPEIAAALGRHPALRRPKARRPTARAISQTWHDSTDHTLARNDLALAESGSGWAIERLGLGWPWQPGTRAAPLAASVHPAGLEEKLGHGLPGPLRPLARFTGEMVRLPLTPTQGPMECRIISGTLTGLDPYGGVAASRAVARAEIEGPLAAALAVVRQLAADLPVTPSLVTLSQEAMLLAGVKLRPSPAPVLTPDMQTNAALTILGSDLVRTFLTRLGQIGTQGGAEPVHQARVTLRRLRALMLAFRPILRDIEAALKPRLAELKSVLGPARDWDVFLAETVDPLAHSLHEADAVTDWLRQAATSRRAAAYGVLTEWLRGPAYRDLAWRLIGLCLGQGWRTAASAASAAPEPAAAIARAPAAPEAAEAMAGVTTAEAETNLFGPFSMKCLSHRWKKTARPTRDLGAMPAPELHGLRIKCKKLRYQTELFLDVVPAKSGRRLIKRLARAQETMGQLNDGVVAADLVRSLCPAADAAAADGGVIDELLAAEAIGLIRGYGVGHAHQTRGAVMQAWRKLVRQDPF